MLDPRGTSIEYSAAVKRDDLVVALCTSRKRPTRDRKFDQAVYISDLLKAVSYKTTYLTDDTVNNLYQRLIEAAEVYDFPVAPVLPTLAVPSAGTTITIVGATGPKGDDGGATDFSELSVGSDTVVDTFAMTDAYGARWDYLVNGTAQRAGTILATWTEDGLAVDFVETSTSDVNGSTAGITFTVTVVGGNVRLNAIVTSGTWDVVGSRYFIPNSGAGVGAISNQLEDGKFYIGDSSDVAQPQALSGDISVTNTGVVSITPNVIVNGDVSPTAAIAVTKLATLTASRAVVTDGSGVLTVSAVTPTEIGYLSGVTSNVQTQLDGKIGSVTGAISTVVAVDLTASRAVMSNGSGKIAVSAVTSTELGYLTGVTAAVQTQLDAMVEKAGDTMSGVLNMGSNKITALATATNPSDAVRFDQLVGLVSGLTTGALPKATSATSLGNSLAVDTGTGISITGTLDASTGIRTLGSDRYFFFQVLNIENWNMWVSGGGSGTGSKTVAHGLVHWKRIKSVEAVIRNDADTEYYNNFAFETYWDATNIYINDNTAYFDINTFSDDTAYTRGYIMITYTNT